MAASDQALDLLVVHLDASNVHSLGLQLCEDGITIASVDHDSLVAGWNALHSRQILPGSVLRRVNGQTDLDSMGQELAQLKPLTLEVELVKDEATDSNVDIESMRLEDRIQLEQQSREAAMEQLSIFIQQAVTTVSNRMEELALTHAESQRQQHSQMRALSQLFTDTQQAQQKQVIRLSRLEELRKGDLQRIEDIEAEQKRFCQSLQRLTEDAQHRSNQVNEALRGIAQDVTSLEQFCRNRRRPSKTDTVNGSDDGASIPTLVASEQGLLAQRTAPVISSVAEDGPLKLKTQTVQPSSSMEVASTKVRTTASSSPASSPRVIATPAESEPAPLNLEPASHPTQATQPLVAQATPGRLFAPESRRVSMDNGKLADWMAVSTGAAAMDPQHGPSPTRHVWPAEVQRPTTLCSPRYPLSPRTAAPTMVGALSSLPGSNTRLLSPQRSAVASPAFPSPSRPLSPAGFHLLRPEASVQSPRLTRMVQGPFPVVIAPNSGYTSSWSQLSQNQGPQGPQGPPAVCASRSSPAVPAAMPSTPPAAGGPPGPVGPVLPATERARRVTSPPRSGQS